MVAFSIWNAIWLVFVSFLFISVLMMLFSIVVDLFRDRELGGVAKAVWMVVLIFFPLFGMIAYVIVRGKGMTERSIKENIDAKESFDAYVRDVAGGGAASELEKAATMHAAGQISDDEFATLKHKILS